MKITYYGHSCFLIETSGGRVIVDPFLTGNPFAPVKAADVKVDFVLLSHGHEDHTGDALEIAKANKALIVGNHEIAEYYAAQGVNAHGMNPGGARDFSFGRVKLTLAHHTSSVNAGLNPVYLGVACGLLVTADEKTLYHAGDTALFLDMELIGKAGIDCAILPIGDNYTMGIDDAVEALGLLKPKTAVPMHYKTFPPIDVDPNEFVTKAKAAGQHAQVMQPGETLEI